MTRLATSFVVMGSTSALAHALALSRVLKSQVLYCGRVVSLFLSVLSGSQRLASLLASRHLFDAISVRSVILVRAWSCDGDFSVLILNQPRGWPSWAESNQRAFGWVSVLVAVSLVPRPYFFLLLSLFNINYRREWTTWGSKERNGRTVKKK